MELSLHFYAKRNVGYSNLRNDKAHYSHPDFAEIKTTPDPGAKCAEIANLRKIPLIPPKGYDAEMNSGRTTHFPFATAIQIAFSSILAQFGAQFPIVRNSTFGIYGSCRKFQRNQTRRGPCGETAH